MDAELRLFVWTGVLCDYTEGVMFALAHNVDEARALLLAGCEYLPENDLAKTPDEYTAPFAMDIWGGG